MSDLNEDEFLASLNKRYGNNGKLHFYRTHVFIFHMLKIYSIESAPASPASSGPSGNADDADAVQRNQDDRQEEDNLNDEPENKRMRINEESLLSGTDIFEDSFAMFDVKRAVFKRNLRFGIDDHLYNLNITGRRRQTPFVSNIAKGLKTALIRLLNGLKDLYDKNNYHQVFVTVIEKNITRGLNSGNYDLATPASIIANRVLSMLYNYLKSYQTLRLNPSFKVQIKVLSMRNMKHLRRSKRKRNKFQMHYYRQRK